MANDWKIKKHDVIGGPSGRLLEGCQIRRNEDGTVNFLGVLATTTEEEGYQFPPFVYKGLIWNIDVDNFDVPEQVVGAWGNNAPRRASTSQEEDGTYTAQAGSGGGNEEDCKEDAASASA